MRRLLADASSLGLGPRAADLARLVAEKEAYLDRVDAKGRRYLNLFEDLPAVSPSGTEFASDRVRIGEAGDLDGRQRQVLLEVLRQLCPWRKGPFEIFGTEIDSEWVSYLKWNRLKDRISPLAGRKVLDIGSSNGYYLFRMAASEPKLALGVEPYLTFYFQYRLLQHYARQPNLHCLPCRFEELPTMAGYFDTIFSMGVLSHRRSPLDSLAEVRRFLRPGGELVLETLVVEGEDSVALVPEGRYAKMNNVYFLPTLRCLTHWLGRTGFRNVRCVDTTRTTFEEQRGTPWVGTESLRDFLDPQDPTRTIEGYPAPMRSVLIAEAAR